MAELIPGAELIYERSNGVTYARYRDPPHNKIPRWPIGGKPESFLPNGDPSEDLFGDAKNFLPNWEYIVKHPEVLAAYKEFLKVQDKYDMWETLNG